MESMATRQNTNFLTFHEIRDANRAFSARSKLSILSRRVVMCLGRLADIDTRIGCHFPGLPARTSI